VGRLAARLPERLLDAGVVENVTLLVEQLGQAVGEGQQRVARPTSKICCWMGTSRRDPRNKPLSRMVSTRPVAPRYR
jgi:hypothetical protein